MQNTDLCIRTLLFFVPLHHVPLSDLFCDHLGWPDSGETELHEAKPGSTSICYQW